MCVCVCFCAIHTMFKCLCWFSDDKLHLDAFCNCTLKSNVHIRGGWMKICIRKPALTHTFTFYLARVCEINELFYRLFEFGAQSYRYVIQLQT